MPRLVLKFRAAVIKEISIDKTPVTIGRKPENDIPIDNMSVSGYHARIIQQGNSFIVEDLKSTNGTFVNDKKILSSALKHHDIIVIGQHSLVFMSPESAVEANPANPDATVVISTEQQNVILNQNAVPAAESSQEPFKEEHPVPDSEPQDISLPTQQKIEEETAPSSEPVSIETPTQDQQVNDEVSSIVSEPVLQEIPSQDQQKNKEERYPVSESVSPKPAINSQQENIETEPTLQKQEKLKISESPLVCEVEKIGVLRVIAGKTEFHEYILSEQLTYAGKSSNAAIKIKGLFAPDIAALISRKPTGYFITAIKEGYPKLNDIAISSQTELKEGDLIEMGGLKFLFQNKEIKPAPSE